VLTMSLEFVSTMSLELFVNYVLDWFTVSSGLKHYPDLIVLPE